MKFHLRRIHLIGGGLVLVAVLFLGMAVVRPMLLERAIMSVLERSGFIAATVQKTDTDGGDVVFESIRLSETDKIERITLKPEKEGRAAIIDGAVLSGTWSPVAGFSGEAWVRPASLKSLTRVLAQQDIHSVLINDAQLILTLPMIGPVPLKIKGQATISPDDQTMRLHLSLWSIEGGLTMQARISGDITPGGMAAIDAELVEGKIAIPGLSVTRMGGWVILNRDNALTPWGASVQLVAGMAEYLGLTFNNLTLSGAGSSEEMTITLQSGTDDHDHNLLSLDLRVGSATQNTLGATLQLPRRDTIIRITSTPDTMADLFKNMSITLHDLNGRQWMQGTLRRSDTGYDLDLVSAWLSEGIALLGLRDLKAGGSVTGLLPLSIGESGSLVIDEGLLKSIAPGGILSTTVKSLPATLEPSRKDSLSLLRNFRYSDLEIYLSGPVSLGLEGDITLRGQPAGRGTPPTEMKFHFRDFVIR